MADIFWIVFYVWANYGTGRLGAASSAGTLMRRNPGSAYKVVHGQERGGRLGATAVTGTRKRPGSTWKLCMPVTHSSEGCGRLGAGMVVGPLQ